MNDKSAMAFAKSLPAGRLIGLGILACGVLWSTGCDRGPKMYQVKGKVLYKDGTVPVGGIAVVSMQPAPDSSPEVRAGATGPIARDGSFAMSTRVAGDGVYAGDYVITFNVAKAVMDPKPLITETYRNPNTSPYKVKVDQDIDDLSYQIEPLPGVKGAPPAAP